MGSPDRIRTGATALRGSRRSLTLWPVDVQIRCRPVNLCQGRGHASGTTRPNWRGELRIRTPESLHPIEEPAACASACTHILQCILAAHHADGMEAIRCRV